ncbi:MAG: efflux RND transporter periplasmic adaptor subunit [Negativicutes bacterium]|jgi:HlyD family secretion protein
MKQLLKKKWFWAIMICLILTGAYFGYRTYSEKNAAATVAVKTSTVKYGSISSVVTATGTVNAIDSVAVGSNTNGQLKKVYVKENDSVQIGQLLAEIDPEKISNQLAQAKDKAENLRMVYQRQLNLYKRGALAKQDLETAELNYDLAVKDVQLNQKSLSDTIITAPASGTIIGEPMAAGQTIGGANLQTILTIANLSKMQVTALIDESDIGKIKIGQRADFTIDAFQYTSFSGTVKTISNKVTTQSSVNYYNVEISVDKTDKQQILLRPGMTARVSIVTGENKHAITVPLLALKESSGKQYVEVQVNGKTEKRQVTVGLTDEDNAEIKSGLAENDVIIIPTAKAGTSSTQKSTQGGGPPTL